MLTTPALLAKVSAEQYHADQLADTPTLSASTAAVLLAKSPAHAWQGHPRNPAYIAPEEKTAYDIGTAVHTVFIEEREDTLHIIRAGENYRTKPAQLERDEARADGYVPLLRKEYDEVLAMVGALRVWREQTSIRPRPFTNGTPEQTVRWEENGVWCRARLDWLHDDGSALDDLKTTTNADARKWTEKTIYDLGYDLRCAFHVRAAKHLGYEPEWRWIAVEKTPPYALRVFSPGPDVLAIANAKVDRALATWKECLASDKWPGYPDRVHYAELPAWEESRWLEKEAREAA